MAVATGTLLFASSAPAEVIANFQPQPVSSAYSYPDLAWNFQQLATAAGAKGVGFPNAAGDGDMPISQQQAPGLTVVSPFEIPGLPGGDVNLASGSTTFYNSTLLIVPTGGNMFGLPAAGSPVQTSLDGITLFSQVLGPGNFQVWTSDPITAPYQATLLLGGFVNNAVITGMVGTTTGSVISASLTYSSGVILTAADAQMGQPMGTPLSGELSWSLEVRQPVVCDYLGGSGPLPGRSHRTVYRDGGGNARTRTRN